MADGTSINTNTDEGQRTGVRKTKKQLAIESRLGEPLEDYIIRRTNEQAYFVEIANELGCSKATLGYWILKLGIRITKHAEME